MKVVALVSGGKDSCHAMYLASAEGHEVVALANLLPQETDPDELDSYMYQTVGHQLVVAYAACMGVPLFRRRLQGTSAKQDLQYSETEGDEVEDLFLLLSYVKEAIPQVSGVSSGAIASDYQRLRVENVCARLNLASLAYMWHQPQKKLLRAMIEAPIDAVIVKVAALGLDPVRHLGRSVAALEPLLRGLARRFGCNVCGEGGEYESLVLDCPLFKHGRIVLDAYEIVTVASDPVAPVGYLRPTSFHVEPKPLAKSCGSFGGHSSSSAPPGSPVAAAAAAAAAAAVAAATGGRKVHSISGGGSKEEVGVHHQHHHGTEHQHHHHHGAGGEAPAPPLPVGDVRMMPRDWAPKRNLIRRSIEYPYQPGQYEVAVQVREGPEYIQVSCRPTCLMPTDSSAEASACIALHDVMTAVRQTCKRLGLPGLPEHCLYCHLYLASMGHFAVVNNVYIKYFPAVDPPSRACVQVPLPLGCPLMLDLLLARRTPPSHKGEPSGSCAAAANTLCHRSVLHVQSISSWAPSCIGPYSQANVYRGLIHIAGTIPLHPGSMTVVSMSDIEAQTQQALRNCEAVAVALGSRVLGAALGLTLYIAAAARDSVGRVLELVEAALDAGGLKGEEAEEGEEEGEGGEGEGLGVDSYLRLVSLPSPLRPTVVAVVVEALPRGCLVEVVPLLVDATGDARRAHDTAAWRGGRRSSSGSGSSKEEEGGGRLSEGLQGVKEGHEGPCASGGGGGGGGLPPLPPMPSVRRHRRQGSISSSAMVRTVEEAPCGSGGSDVGSAASSPAPPQQHCGGGGTPEEAGAGAHAASPTGDPLPSTPDPCGTSAAAAAASGVGGPPMVPPGTPVPSDAALVTSVCYLGSLLKSTFHLPLAVFQPDRGFGGLTPGGTLADAAAERDGAGATGSAGGAGALSGMAYEPLMVRLQRAVAGVLAAHGMVLDDIVTLEAWHDVNRVPAVLLQLAELGGPGFPPASASLSPGFHITWIPVLGVCSSACSANCAAILEVVAQC